MNHIMIDIETMGTGCNAVITQIGACYFEPKTGEIGKTFNRNISITDSLCHGFEVDSGAIHFWMEQAKKGKFTFLDNTQPVKTVLADLKFWGINGKYIWSHSTFDFVLIANACSKIGVDQCFHYQKTRDIRTFCHLVPEIREDDDKERPDAHDALNDAIYQAGYVSKGLQKIMPKKVCSK